MTASIKTLVAQFCASSAKLSTLAANIGAQLDKATRTDRSAIRAELLPLVAEWHGAIVKESQNGGFTMADPNGKTDAAEVFAALGKNKRADAIKAFNNAKSDLNRLIDYICPSEKKGNGKAAIVTLTRAQKQVAATLATYEANVATAILRAASEIRKANKA